MHKLFNHDEPVVSNEMITAQTNDWVVPAIAGIFQEIIDANTKYAPANSKLMFTKKPYKQMYAKLDDLIAKRFGVTVKSISAIGVGYAVMTTPPSGVNTINREHEQSYNQTSDILDFYGKTDENTAPKDVVVDYNTQVLDVLQHWKKSTDSLDKLLNTNSIIIDLNKARIDGLPKDYMVYLLSDPVALINDAGLTARELTAVLLHELGHMFTHLEYSYRSVNNTSVLVDTLHENLRVKGKPFKESIALTYKELGGGDDLSKTNAVVATIKLADIYIKMSSDMDKSNNSYTDSEQLADQFASRFGVGSELTSGLDKVISASLSMNSFLVRNSAVLSMYLLYFIMWALLSSLGFAFFLVAVGIITYMITSLLSSIVTGGNSNNNDTYDNTVRRMERIRNDSVRQLRTMDLDKKLTLAIIEDIDAMHNIIAKTKKMGVGNSVLDNIMRKALPWGRKNVKLRDLEVLVEDLQENLLHVSSNKLKTLV